MKIKLITIVTLSLLSLVSCDKRKDILSEREELENEAPTLAVRRYQSGKAYEKSLIDTFLVPSTGYKLQYSVNDKNVDIGSLNLVAVSSATNVLSITHIKDSSYYLIKLYSNIGAMNFIMSIKDKFNLTSEASFRLVSINQRPSLTIKKAGTLTYTTNIVDTLKTLNSITYNLDYLLNDDNALPSNIQIIKRTVGDLSVINNNTTTRRISIDFSGTQTPKTYKYDIVVSDPFSLVSDTSKISIYAYKNLPPNPVLLASATASVNYNPADTTNTIYLPYSPTYLCDNNYNQMGIYGTGIANMADCSVKISTTDKDFSQGGYITKIKYKVTYKLLGLPFFMTCSNWNTNVYGVRTLYMYNSIGTITDLKFSLNIYNYSVGPVNISSYVMNPFTNTGGSANIAGYIYDNNNDSTYFNINPVF